MNIPEISSEFDAISMVSEILAEAVHRDASDIHIEPTANGTEVRMRIDGLLEVHSTHDSGQGRSLVARLMVLAHLLTYRLDIPQEGRLRVQLPAIDEPLELRLAVMPTTHGLRAAVRMPAELIQPRALDQLGLPEPVLAGLKRFAAADAGMLLVTGPAGSGKTTTIYALLEHMAAHSQGLSLVSLEDPVERDLGGVTQIEVSPFGQLTYERALRSILRQDPQVLMLGEIRDAETASLAVQAALSGHRLICTLHASNPGGAIARLLEMGLEPYRITSALYGVVAQRLLRKLAKAEAEGIDEGRKMKDKRANRVTGASPVRATPSTGETPVTHYDSSFIPSTSSGQALHPSSLPYKGRVPAAEFVAMTGSLRAAILERADAGQLQQIASREMNYSSLRDSAHSLVARHLTDLAEVERVLGEA